MKLIGKAALIQRALTPKFTRIREAIRRGEPVSILERRHLFTGKPGLGKTELAKILTRLLVDCPGGSGDSPDLSGNLPESPLSTPTNSPCLWNIEKINGSGVTRDAVLEWVLQAHYKPLTGQVTVKWVEEIEGASASAIIDLRTYLDDLPNHRIFIATTNKRPDELPEPLQSRFQVWHFTPTPTAELAAHLVEKYKIAPAAAQKISQDCAGNVRAAESDALTHIDALAALAA